MLVSHNIPIPPVSAIQELAYIVARSVSTVKCFYSGDEGSI